MSDSDFLNDRQPISAEETSTWNRQKLLFWLLVAGTVVHISCILILASVPPVSRDALDHHLAVPKMYLRNGGIYEIPSIRFSYFPMNLDLLYLLPLYFKIDFAAKYIHFMFALFTAGLLYRYLKEKLNSIYGLIGVLFFLTIPVIVKLSVTAYVDLGLIFFSWASLYYFLKWYDCGFQLRQLMFSALACGLALGTKYNGLILLLIMSVLVPLTYSITKNKTVDEQHVDLKYSNSFKGLQGSVIFVLVALALFSPWMIRNVIWKHNPVYPLFQKIFNQDEKIGYRDSIKEKKPPKNAFWIRRHVYKESFIQAILIPIRIFFQGRDDSPQYFDGKLNPFLLLFPLFSLVRLRGSPLADLTLHRNILGIFAVLFSLFVLFKVDFRIRYMAPALPALVVLSIFGLRNLLHLISYKAVKAKKAVGAFIVLTGIMMFGLNGNYVYGQFKYIQPMKYLTGEVSRDHYITYFRDEYPAILYANQNIPKDAQVLCLLIGDRTYYLDRSVHLAKDFFRPKEGGFSEGLILERLGRYGTTHIILGKDYFLDWLSSLPEKDRDVFVNTFQDHTRLLFEKYGVVLLEFLPNG